MTNKTMSNSFDIVFKKDDYERYFPLSSFLNCFPPN